MPRNTEVQGENTDGADTTAPRAKRARAKNGTRRPRADKSRFVVTVEIETTQAGLQDVTQLVESLSSDGTTARIKGVAAK
jgi:hypothetical protein